MHTCISEMRGAQTNALVGRTDEMGISNEYGRLAEAGGPTKGGPPWRACAAWVASWMPNGSVSDDKCVSVPLDGFVALLIGQQRGTEGDLEIFAVVIGHYRKCDKVSPADD